MLGGRGSRSLGDCRSSKQDLLPACLVNYELLVRPLRPYTDLTNRFDDCVLLDAGYGPEITGASACYLVYNDDLQH